tara:strand:+ start:59088 stop:62345 length:3258 start_codon:yes stop_codon:yes gene_type:complete
LIFLFGACSDTNEKLFSLVTPDESNVEFVNLLVENEELNIMKYDYLYNGGGVAIGDINQDGLEDIYFSGNMVDNRLYLNKGNFKFEDITEKAGVAASNGWSSGVTMADVNCDGLLDIYVCRSAFDNYRQRKNLLYINNGDLTFTEKAKDYGIDDSGYSTQATFFDYDQDGDLDMYLLNHSLSQYSDFNEKTKDLKTRNNPLFGDKFFKNIGGKFEEVTKEAGIKSNVLGFGLGVAVSDINNDGWLDIYVCNDFNEQDYLYINDQKGGFTEQLEHYFDHVSLNSMGNDIADINNDGHMDILTLDMLPEDNYRQKMMAGPDNYYKFSLLEQSGFYHQSMRNMLQLNHGNDLGFAEIGQMSGVSNTDWSWAGLMADFDNDGHKDIFITNGFKHNFTDMDFIQYLADETIKQRRGGPTPSNMRMVEEMPPIVVPNYMFRNKGNLSFEPVAEEWGLGQPGISNGAAYADLDNDGDLDIVVNNLDDNASIYRNNSRTHNGNHALKVMFEGSTCNAFGIGARVKIHTGGQLIVQEHTVVRGFQSSVGNSMVIGLGDIEVIDSLIISWPDQKQQKFFDLSVDTTYHLSYRLAADDTHTPTEKPSLFVKSKGVPGLNYTHEENYFNDFDADILLPHMLSTQGPAMAMGDINGDGLDDLYAGASKGYAGAIYIQQPDRTFSGSAVFAEDANSEDLDALFFDADGDGDNDLYVVSGGSEFTDGDASLQDRLYLNNGSGQMEKANTLPVMLTSGSCVIPNDIDQDGDLDLFVGGRLKPGGYPVSPRSYILENDGSGSFSDVTETMSKDLMYPGMVTDAVWSDFDGDGAKDLILVGEWMPVTLFRNTGNGLEKLADSTGLEDTEGWWNTIVAHDVDMDGDDDYLVGNLGLNAQLKASTTHPVSLLHKDFDGDGVVDPILSYFIDNESYPALSRDDLIAGMNYLKQRFNSYAAYAETRTKDIFTEQELDGASTLLAKTLESGWIENKGAGNFSWHTFPQMAQVSPIYSILPGDFNQDGYRDVILGGNFSRTRVKFGRYDANNGVLLLGNQQGELEYARTEESGLNINGEVRKLMMLPTATDSVVVVLRNNGPMEFWKMK